MFGVRDPFYLVKFIHKQYTRLGFHPSTESMGYTLKIIVGEY